MKTDDSVADVTHFDVISHGRPDLVPKFRNGIIPSHPRRTWYPELPIHDILKCWVVGHPFVQVSRRVRVASPCPDCPIYIGHQEGCPWRLEGSSRRQDWLSVEACETERKFCKIHKTARSEHMAYVINQTVVVADLIIHKYSFTVDRQGRATYS